MNFRLKLGAWALFALLHANWLHAASADDKLLQATATFQAGELHAAQSQLMALLQQDPSNLEALMLLGRTSLLRGNAALAEATYSDALLLGAGPDEAAIGLAESYLKQGKHRDIIGHLPLQAASTSAEAELLGYHALAYLHLNKPEQATNAIGLALDAAPQAVMPQVARVRLLLMAGMVAEAHALAARTASHGRESARAWHALGLSAQIAGDHSTAITAYGRANRLDPHLMSARINRIRLLLGEGREKEASQDLAFTARHYPTEPTAAFLRGMASERAGEENLAQEEFRRAADAFSQLPLGWIAGNPQTTVAAATAHLRLGDSDGARHYLEASHALSTSNRHTTVMLAALLLEQNEPERALMLVDNLLLSEPQDQDLLELRAHCRQLLAAQQLADQR